MTWKRPRRASAPASSRRTADDDQGDGARAADRLGQEKQADRDQHGDDAEDEDGQARRGMRGPLGQPAGGRLRAGLRAAVGVPGVRGSGRSVSGLGAAALCVAISASSTRGADNKNVA